MITKAILTAGVTSINEKIEKLVTILSAKERIVLGGILKRVSETLLSSAIESGEVKETFTHGHVKVTYSKSYQKAKYDYSSNKEWVELNKWINEIESKMKESGEAKKSITDVKACYKFDITG
jgi:hypothetical protein